MEKKIIATGKTIDQAVESALAQLGLACISSSRRKMHIGA